MAGGGGPPPAGQEGIGRVSKELSTGQRRVPPRRWVGAPTHLCSDYIKGSEIAAPAIAAGDGGRARCMEHGHHTWAGSRTGAPGCWRMAQRRSAAGVARSPRTRGRPRLLDVLLHQLPSRHRGASTARGALRRPAGGDRRALPEVPARGRPRRGCRSRRPPSDRPPGAGRPGAGDVAAVRRSRLADAGGDRP